MQTKPKILLVDDEKGILDSLSFFLERNGFQVDVAQNGQEGLEKILRSRYDGVVSDWKMPVLDGLGLIKKVRAENIVIPFIFLSGHAEIRHEHEMVNFGAYKLIHKMDFKKTPEVLRAMLVIDNKINSPSENAHQEVEFLELINNISKVS